jgi:hypothetical protein
MQVRYSFGSRHTKRLENIRKQRQKYPDIAKKVIDNSDIVLEVLDARFIQETRNLEIEEKIKSSDKRIIYVLNKADLLANGRPKLSKEELSEIYPYILVSVTKRKGIKELRERIKMEAKKVKEPIDKTLGKFSVGIIGYPNTGKSSIINILIGKSSAPVASQAGHTKGFQKLKLTPNIMLIDSPGVIPASEYSTVNKELISKNAQVGGRSYNQVKYPELVISNIIKNYPNVLEKHYKIEANGDAEIFMEELGRRKGFLKKGNEINEDQTARFILKEWQEGKIKF